MSRDPHRRRIHSYPWQSTQACLSRRPSIARKENSFLSKFTRSVILVVASLKCALAQSSATASRAFVPSVFAGATGTSTGLSGGRNLGITVGGDLGLHPFSQFLPSVEVRGSLPIDNGHVVGQTSLAGGIRVQRRFNNIRPYADLLFGRGRLIYENGGYIVPAQSYRYLKSSSNLIEPGLGVEIDLSKRLALFVDAQCEHWSLPFTPGSNSAAPGSLFAKSGTIGTTYRFDWLRHGHPAP